MSERGQGPRCLKGGKATVTKLGHGPGVGNGVGLGVRNKAPQCPKRGGAAVPKIGRGHGVRNKKGA